MTASHLRTHMRDGRSAEEALTAILVPHARRAPRKADDPLSGMRRARAESFRADAAELTPAQLAKRYRMNLGEVYRVLKRLRAVP